MKYIYKVALILLPAAVLALAGCGSSSSGSTSTDPLNSAVSSGGTTQVNGSGYAIDFMTSKSATDPDGSLNTLSYTISADSGGYFTFKQLIPFQVMDNNGIPMPNVDVSIQVNNFGRNADTIVELVPPWPGVPVVFPPDITKVTLRTDDKGLGMFTCNVSI
ncbi:MAG: hypothetical protein H7X83_07245, partial [Verrucomicrobia bacterium]|nr:hypothetical protein [Deltaproteobacteria bacterium]